MAAAQEAVHGRIISDQIIAARAGWSREIARGQVLRLVDGEIRY